MEVYKVIGLMSGTSLDGVDLAFCEFTLKDKWSFRILKAETIAYDARWKNDLGSAHLASASEISHLDSAYGNFLGGLVNDFSAKHKIAADFISSHGHTVFHQPHIGFTKQIGSGAHIASVTETTVVCDFRSGDVALKGQGAPLVPIGDRLLFSEMDYCLNLGGIANISFEKDGQRIAYDICPCNLLLNHLSLKLGFDFDASGSMARKGRVNQEILSRLNDHDYFRKNFPKSLGREDIDAGFIPLIDAITSVEDALATSVKHIAMHIALAVKDGKKDMKMLVTGGGALNTFLVENLRNECDAEIVIPDEKIIAFKEAIIFAFLGVLRMRNEVNCLSSVTGAIRDSCGGAVYG